MEAKPRFMLGRQSSLAPLRGNKGSPSSSSSLSDEEEGSQGGSSSHAKRVLPEKLDATIQLLYLAMKGDIGSMEEALLSDSVDVNYADFDDRTALHVAACQGNVEIVTFLIRKGANINARDRWGSTPLADAKHYGNTEVCTILEQNGAKISGVSQNIPMKVSNPTDVPEYELDPDELINKKDLSAKHKLAKWHGTMVVVRVLPDHLSTHAQSVNDFRDELALLLKLRHPNIVQFLGAVTQNSPMRIVEEYCGGLETITLSKHLEIAKFLGNYGVRFHLVKSSSKLRPADIVLILSISSGMYALSATFLKSSSKLRPADIVLILSISSVIETQYEDLCTKGDLGAHLQKMVRLDTAKAVRYAIDIARGLNYLHQCKPEPIIHRNLKPRYVMRDGMGHVKVCGFGLDTLLDDASKAGKHHSDVSCYKAPEVLRGDGYDKSVDVFSFAIILHQMIEGSSEFHEMGEKDAVDVIAHRGMRPQFKAKSKKYPAGLKELIQLCWDKDPSKRPLFSHIIAELEKIKPLCEKQPFWRKALRIPKRSMSLKSLSFKY